jgi:hypothetical protein
MAGATLGSDPTRRPLRKAAATTTGTRRETMLHAILTCHFAIGSTHDSPKTLASDPIEWHGGKCLCYGVRDR